MVGFSTFDLSFLTFSKSSFFLSSNDFSLSEATAFGELFSSPAFSLSEATVFGELGVSLTSSTAFSVSKDSASASFSKDAFALASVAFSSSLP